MVWPFNLLEKVDMSKEQFLSQHLKSISHHGDFSIQDTTAEDVSVLGAFQFSGLAARLVKITGPIRASKNGNIEVLTVIGPVEVFDSIIKTASIVGQCYLLRVKSDESFDVTGALHVQFAAFEKLCLTTQKSELKKCVAKEIEVRPSIKEVAPTLVLSGESKIDSISFPLEGKVLVIGDAVQLGKVSGGQIEAMSNSDSDGINLELSS